jgi:hypothetical protein
MRIFVLTANYEKATYVTTLVRDSLIFIVFRINIFFLKTIGKLKYFAGLRRLHLQPEPERAARTQVAAEEPVEGAEGGRPPDARDQQDLGQDCRPRHKVHPLGYALNRRLIRWIELLLT